jgi:hypothetical protein
MKRVWRIAPRATKIARGQAHEDARPPGVRRFALDRVEDFVDSQHDFDVAPRKVRNLEQRLYLLYVAAEVQCPDAQTDSVSEADVNDLPQRQKFSGAAEDRVRRTGHQQEST